MLLNINWNRNLKKPFLFKFTEIKVIVVRVSIAVFVGVFVACLLSIRDVRSCE